MTPKGPGKCYLAVTIALFLCLVGRGGTAASTREDLERLQAQVAALNQQMQRVDAQQAALMKGLQDLQMKIEAMGRASQTADIRADLEVLKRQIEALQSQVGSLRGEALRRMPLPAPLPGEPPPAPAVGDRGADELYNMAHKDFIQARYDLSIAEFKQFISNFPWDVKAANAQYWIGECLYSQRRYSEARDAFQTVLDKYPKSSKINAAKLKVAFCLLGLGDQRKGRQALEALVADAPDSEEAALAKERMERLDLP